MGTASVRLHDGTVIVATFRDNNDGHVQSDERTRAQSALRAELVRLGRSGSELDANANIYMMESGTDAASPRARDDYMTAGGLARNGTVRLFGANPTQTIAGVSDPALWRPAEHGITAEGRRYVLYQEADHWDESTSSYRSGRRVRVYENGEEEVRMGGGSPSSDDPEYGMPLRDYSPPAGREGIPTLPYIAASSLTLAGDAPANDGTAHTVAVRHDPIAVSAMQWVPVGTQDDFVYFQAGEEVLRRSISNPGHAEVMHTRGTGPNGMTGAVWRTADAADAIPIPVTVGTGERARMYAIVSSPRATGEDENFDYFTGRRAGSAETLRFRRARGDFGAHFHVLQGSTYVDAATVSTSPTVAVGAAGHQQTYVLTPANPATAGGYDMFTGTANGTTLTFRRRTGAAADAPFEVREGSRWVAPGDYGTPGARPNRVGGNGGGSGRRPSPRGPDVFY